MRQLFGIDIGGTSVKWAIVNENYELVTVVRFRRRSSRPISWSTRSRHS